MNAWEKRPSDEDEPLTPESLDKPIKRGRGRPVGSKTKVPESLLTLDKLRSLYTRVKPILPDDERRYVEGVLDGSIEVDPVLEMRILVRQMSVVFAEATVWHLANGQTSRDYAAFGNNLRMAITDLYKIDQMERERLEKAQVKDDMVRLRREGSEMERLYEAIREVSQE